MSVFLDKPTKLLPYEDMYKGRQCLLKEVKDWVIYKEGKPTNEVQGARFRCFYPELERSLWVKVKGCSIEKFKEIPNRGIAVTPKNLRVTIYANNKDGIDFSATAEEIVPSNITEDDLLA